MEESIYYNRLMNVLFNTCSEVLRAVLPVLIQNDGNYMGWTVSDFVTNKRDDILQKRFGKRYEEKLFPTRGRKTNIKNWDITLLCFITYDILQPDWKVKANIDMLRDIRNDLCHPEDTFVNQKKYDRLLKTLKDINNMFLGLVNNETFTQEIKEKTTDIVNSCRDVDEAACDVLLDWLEIEKKPLLEKCTLSADKRKILDYLVTLFKSKEGPDMEIPDTKLVLNVKNCIKEQEISTCRQFVDYIRSKSENNPDLQPLTDQFCQIVEEAFQKFLGEGQIVVNAALGCVILTIKSPTFGSLESLWMKCVNGELTKAFSRLQTFLRETYQNQLEIEVILPEEEFWEAINRIVKDLQIKLPEGHSLDLPEPESVNEDALEEQEVMVQSSGGDHLATLTPVKDLNEVIPTKTSRSCLEGRVVEIKQSLNDDWTKIEMILRPRSWKQLEHMKDFSSSGKLADTFQKMAEKLQKIMNVKDLRIDTSFSLLKHKDIFTSSTDTIYFPKKIKESEVPDSTDSIYVPQKVLLSSESFQSFYKQGKGADLEHSSDFSDSMPIVDIHPPAKAKDSLTARNGMQISLLRHNIADREAKGDVLVISSSKKLVLQTGTSGKAVLKEAGQELQQELKSKYPKGIEYGDIAEGTMVGKLGFKVVYVTALPDWKGDNKVIRSVTAMCLELAANSNLHSVVFSALGCGGSNYPKDEAARALFEAVLEFDLEHPHTPIKEVAFLLYPKDRATIQAFEEELRERQKIQLKQDEGKAALDQFRRKWEFGCQVGTPVTIREGKTFLRDAFQYILEVDVRTQLTVIIDEGQGSSSKGPDVKNFFRRIFDISLREESGMFSGLDRNMCCIPSDNYEACSQRWFFALGRAIVLSQVHGGPAFQHLAEYVVQYIVGGDYEKHLNILMVSDKDLVELIQKINRCDTLMDFKACCKEDEHYFLKKSSWTGDIIQEKAQTAEHCEKLTQHLLKWYLVDKRREALEQLKEGMNTLNFLDHMRRIPGFLNILQYQGGFRITASNFKESIEKSLKAIKTESESHETARLLMLNFMDQMTDEDATMFAQFISGTRQQPVLRSHFDIQFNTADESQTAPLAEPMIHKLKLPLGNKSKEEFFHSIRKAIQFPPESPS